MTEKSKFESSPQPPKCRFCSGTHKIRGEAKRCREAQEMVFCCAIGTDCAYESELKVAGDTTTNKARLVEPPSEDWQDFWETKGLTYILFKKTLWFDMKYLVVKSPRSGDLEEKNYLPDRTSFFWSKCIFCNHALAHWKKRRDKDGKVCK